MLDKRSPTASLYGIKGASYLLYTPKATAIQRGPAQTCPLDELVLLDRGLPTREDDEEEEELPPVSIDEHTTTQGTSRTRQRRSRRTASTSL